MLVSEGEEDDIGNDSNLGGESAARLPSVSLKARTPP